MRPPSARCGRSSSPSDASSLQCTRSSSLSDTKRNARQSSGNNSGNLSLARLQRSVGRSGERLTDGERGRFVDEMGGLMVCVLHQHNLTTRPHAPPPPPRKSLVAVHSILTNATSAVGTLAAWRVVVCPMHWTDYIFSLCLLHNSIALPSIYGVSEKKTGSKYPLLEMCEFWRWHFCSYSHHVRPTALPRPQARAGLIRCRCQYSTLILNTDLDPLWRWLSIKRELR